jgi:hypothetical protein
LLGYALLLLLLLPGASPQPPLSDQVIHLPGGALLVVPVEALLLGPLGGLPAGRVVRIPRHDAPSN